MWDCTPGRWVLRRGGCPVLRRLNDYFLLSCPSTRTHCPIRSARQRSNGFYVQQKIPYIRHSFLRDIVHAPGLRGLQYEDAARGTHGWRKGLLRWKGWLLIDFHKHWQEIEPSAGVRRGHDQRFLRHIQPGDGIQRVEIRRHDPLEIGGWIFWDAHEHVYRAFTEFFPRFDVCELLSGEVHRD